METNWLELEQMPLYAAVKAAEVLERLRSSRTEIDEIDSVTGFESTDRTASILTFRVRFDAAAHTEPSPDLCNPIHNLQRRKAN
jgi:hypothetical protein